MMLAFFALAGACGTTNTAGDGTTADAGLGFGDVGKDAKDTKDSTTNKPDVLDVADEEVGDAEDVSGTTDTATGEVDASTDTDSGGKDFDCTLEPGAPGCPCQENGTCDLPICLPTAQGSQCAKSCIDACPDGFKCVGVAGPGGDLQTVCVDKSPHLCDPCVNSAQCGAVGLQGAACIDTGKDGKFCGTACKLDADCPTDFVCNTVTSVEGNSAQQCQPKAGATCTCSPLAIADQLSTQCFAEAKDGDGNVVGQCKGARSCSQDGLSTCNASIQTETCNGQDDDCDGLVDEGTCDDKNPCTMDTCDGKATTCNHTNAPGSCDADGNLCTVGDTCVDGKCAIGSLKSCDDNNPCTTDACDPLIGCTKTFDDGLPCSDGSGCTVGDACASGVCESGAAKICPEGDACTSFACDSATGQCKESQKPDGTSCSDGTVCTAADVCTGGGCVGKPVDCDDKNPCTLDTCDAVAQCKHDAANTPCNDNNACTTDDTCAAKKCAGTPIVIATECGDGNPCTTDTCDKVAGCLNSANTVSCSDGNACTVGDKCDQKVCKSGTNTCTCQTDAECLSSEDGNACNGTLFCDTSGPSNQCKVNPATIINCNTSGDTACVQTVCDAGTGKCAASNAPDGKSCDADGTVCTPNDVCVSGVCKAGTTKNCDDNKICTDDACDPVLGCVNTANVSPCSDGDGCTVNDACSGTYCVSGAKKNCSDGSDCTKDACDPSSGTCNNDPIPANGSACDADGSVCTQGDKCVSGTCVAGTLSVCADTNPCTTDYCDTTKGCGHTPLPDGTACGAAGNWCQSLKCVKQAVCGDNVVDSGEACDDGNLIDGDGCSSTCQWDKAVVPGPGELIITEVMGAANIPDDEWVEVYNASTKPLLLEGLYFGDNQYYLQIANNNWVLQPGQYATLAALTDIGGTAKKIGAVTPDWTYGYSSTGPQLGNGGDGICISTGKQTTQNCAKHGQIAFISWNSIPSAHTGHAMTLKLSKYSSEYASGATSFDTNSWCYDSLNPIGGGGGEYGTPGAPDPDCP